MFKVLGHNSYQLVIASEAASSEKEGSVDPSLSKVSSVGNTAVTLTRRQLPDACQLISGDKIYSSYANLKESDHDLLGKEKWGMTRSCDVDFDEINGVYKDAHIFIQTDLNSKPVFTYAKVYPPIHPDIKFDSLEDLFRFVEQREDAASARGAEAQVKHSISEVVNPVRVGRELAGLICDRVHSKEQFDSLLVKQDEVVVVLNGDMFDPEDGHSVFFAEGLRHELSLSTLELINQRRKDSKVDDAVSCLSFISDGISDKAVCAVVLDKIPTKWRMTGLGVDEYFDSKHAHLIKKGVVFSVKKEFAKYFKSSLGREIEYVKKEPFEFGKAYNCNTFTANVLKNMHLQATGTNL